MLDEERDLMGDEETSDDEELTPGSEEEIDSDDLDVEEESSDE